MGTRYSAISYCILDPGKVPKIQSVNRNIRYPAQEHSGGYSKIPSILYYNSNGTICAVGAEAQQEHIIEMAKDEEWMKLECYIKETHPSRSNLWQSLENCIKFVFTHPNDWDGPQQTQIRLATVLAGLNLSAYSIALSLTLIKEIAAAESQEHSGGYSKIPSILYYNSNGTICAVGAEAQQEHIIEMAKDEEWMKLECYIKETHPSRSNLWQSLENCIKFVFTHPNDWDGPQQTQIRLATVLAGLNLSAYSIALSLTLIKEIAAAECRLQGSLLMTHCAHGLLQGLLACLY
ncbi:hypothetical protein BDR04DRAFT_1119060 [Suillus decipiens]|nr:hypothetical protein BDR04DRAFT_1119060 [Suillus decipiens]